jgi:xylan 1,4-beta-xylosidase
VRAFLIGVTVPLCMVCLHAEGDLTPSNPILPGFHPDPSVCRVGEDYYLATSSFEYFPGVPIFRSRDLVHWTPLGHALSGRDQIDLGKARCDGGIFAPTLRHHGGLFYMVTTLTAPVSGTNNQHGDFIVTAPDPKGPWSRPHWIEGALGIDPSLFFDDDGSVYLCGNRKPEAPLNEKHRVIWIRKLDLATWRLEGPEGVLDAAPYFSNGKLGSVSNFEGPHLYKKDGSYYLLISHGGTGKNHAVSIWKSSSPLGPWEENPDNPILTQRPDRKDRTPGITCTGHADLVQGTDGRWWVVFLGVRGEEGVSPMGRETFLEPVDWSGTWPVVNPRHEGRADFTLSSVSSAKGVSAQTAFHDDFTEHSLSPEWSMIRTPESQWWSFPEHGSGIFLQARAEELTGSNNPSFLGVRITQPDFEASTRLSFSPDFPSECAGLAVERSSSASWMLVVENAGNGLGAAVYEGTKRLASVSLKDDGVVDLKISMHFPTMEFSYRQGTGGWNAVAACDVQRIATVPTGHFTGAMVGLCASSRGRTSEQKALFRLFDYQPLPR